MDRGIHILADKLLVKENRVLVVVTLPGHKADKSILTERDLTALGSGTVCNNLSCLNALTLVNDRSLVYAGALVRALELDKVVGTSFARVTENNDLRARSTLNDTALLGNNNCTGVNRCLVLHTGSNDRRVGHHKRHCLLLHVRTHERTGVVVVLKERNTACRNRYSHLGACVHKVNLGGLNLDVLGVKSADNSLVYEVAVLVKPLVSLSNNVVVLFIRGEVNNLVGHTAGLLVNDSVGSLKEAVIADLCIRCKVGDKTDVGTLGSLNGTDSTVVCIVYVTDLEGRSVSRNTAGAESRKTALVSKLSQGVVLVHELGKRRGSEELTDSGRYGTGVDKRLGTKVVRVVCSHTLLDVLVHSGHTDSQLVLKKLTYAAKSSVAKMVDIVCRANAVSEAKKIVDRGKDIFLGNVLRAKLCESLGDELLDVSLLSLALEALGLCSSDDLGKDTESNLLTCLNTAVGKVVAENKLGTNGVVAEHLNLTLKVSLNENLIYKAVLNCNSKLAGDLRSCLCNDLACERINHGLSKDETLNSSCKSNLTVVLITTNSSKVVSLGIEEHIVDKNFSRLNVGGLTGTELLVYLLKSLLAIGGAVLLCKSNALVLHQGSLKSLLVTEHRDDRVVIVLTGSAKRTDKHADGKLTVLVDLNVEETCRIALILKPCSSVRNYCCGEIMFALLVNLIGVVHSGGTHQLGYDNSLCTVNNKGAVIGHEGEVAEEDLRGLKLAGSLIYQTNTHLHMCIVGHRSVLTLLNRISGSRINCVVGKLDGQISGVVHYGRYVAENLVKSLPEEPLVRVLLHLDKIRHFRRCLDLGKAHSHVGAKLTGFKHHKKNHSILQNFTNSARRSEKSALLAILSIFLEIFCRK